MDADCVDTGWLDDKIHAFGIVDGEPVPPEKYFGFWVVPATLVFYWWDVATHLDGVSGLLNIDAVHRDDSPDTSPDRNGISKDTISVFGSG